MRRFVLTLLVILVPSLASAQPKIVIDPGHGGTDPGGVGTGLQEKNVVLDVSKRFRDLLNADTADTKGGGKWVALMTRSTDVFVSLSGRAEYSNSNNADRFMCIHSNAFSDPAANGTETFSFSGTGTAATLRNQVQAEMLAAWGLTNRGNKTADFAVLRDTAAPAELHEMAFITNATDAAHLASATERQKAAVAHLRAIQRHYNITPYVPGTPPPQDKPGEIGGTVIDDLGPIEGATVKLDDGTSVVTPADGTFLFTKVPAGAHVATASANGHEAKMVDVAVASGVRSDTDIQLIRNGEGAPPPDDQMKDGGGCSASGGGAGAALLLGLALVVRRRRRG